MKNKIIKDSVKKVNAFVSILLIIFIQSCTNYSTADKLLSEGKCEEALLHIPSLYSSEHINDIKGLSGSTGSYFLTGVAYGTEYILKITGGIVYVIVMCSPAIAAQILAKSGYGNLNCLQYGNINSFFSNIKLGKNVYNQTESWRCPYIDSVSAMIRKVSQCYSDKNSCNEKKLAVDQLEYLMKSPIFTKCISIEEQSLVQKQQKMLEEVLAKNCP